MKTRILSIVLVIGILVSPFFLLTGTGAIAAEKPIKIGLVTDLTGFLNICGIYIRMAAIMALEEANNTVAGHPVEFIIEDEAGSPATAMDKARKLIETDKVSLILGPFHGGAVVALANYCSKVGIPQLVTWYSIPSATMLQTRWSWCAIGALDEMSVGGGAYMYDVLGYRTATTLGLDYVAGREFMGGATRTFQQKGGKIIQEQWMPMDTKDVAPYLTNLKEADVFMPWWAGVTHNVGMRQIREYNVKMPIFMPQAGWMDTPKQLQDIADYGVGMMTSDAYVWTIDTPENKAFVEKFQKRWGELPAGPAYGGYFNMKIALEALRKTGGDTSPKALAKALDQTKIKGFLGDIYFGDARLGVGNYFVHQCIKTDHKEQPYRTKVLARYQIRPVKAGDKVKFEIIDSEIFK